MSAVSEPIRDLLREALGVWEVQFDGNDDIDVTVLATNLVDWFSNWRQRLKRTVASTLP